MKRLIDDIRLPLLILTMLVQAFLLLRLDWTTSPNRTELGHMAASLRLYETNEYDLFHVNPPILRHLIGPVVAAVVQPSTDWNAYSPDPLARSEWASGVAIVKANDFDTVRQMFFLGRILCIPFILLGGYFGYRFAKELFGEPSGFVFLGLWTFSPLILGWGATICPDVASASLGIVTLYVYWHWIKKPTWLSAFLSGLTLGLLPLTKLTWIIALGLWPLMAIFTTEYTEDTDKEISGSKTLPWRPCFPWLKKYFGQLLFIFILAVFVINLGYRFDGSFTKLGDYEFHSRALTNENGVNRFSGTVLGSIPVPLPKHFVLGFDTQKVDFEKGLPSYLLGEHADHGWWSYYLVAMAVKEPIGYLLLAVSAFALFFFAGYRSTWRDELVLAIPMVALFFIVSSQAGFSLHARYIIPFLPLFYIWISRAGKMFLTTECTENTEEKKCKIVRLSMSSVISVVILSGIASSLYVYPHSMSYINELSRNRVPPVLLGSNIDWGQDYFELNDWLDEHPEARPIRVAMSNIFPLEIFGVRSDGLPPKWKPGQKPTGPWETQLTQGPQPGWYLIGTNDLFGPSHDFDWLRELEPTERIGYSIYIFHVDLDRANRLREKDDLPLLNEEDY